MLSTGDHRHFPCPAHPPAAQPPAAGARAGSCPFHALKEKGDAPQRRAHSTADNEQGRPDSPTEAALGTEDALRDAHPMPAPQWEPSQAHGGKLGNKYAVGRGLFPCGAPWTPHNLPPLHPGHSPALRRQPLRSPPGRGSLPEGRGDILGGQAGWAVPPLALSPAAASAAQPPRRWGFIGGRRRGPARPLWGGGMRGGGRAAGSLRRLRTRSAPAPHPLRSAGGTAPPPSPSVPTRGHRRLLPGLGSRGARRAAGGRAAIASPGGGERLGCRGVLGRVPKRAEVKAPLLCLRKLSLSGDHVISHGL